MELREFTEYLVKSIAKEPDMVSVQEFGEWLMLFVH